MPSIKETGFNFSQTLLKAVAIGVVPALIIGTVVTPLVALVAGIGILASSSYFAYKAFESKVSIGLGSDKSGYTRGALAGVVVGGALIATSFSSAFNAPAKKAEAANTVECVGVIALEDKKLPSGKTATVATCYPSK